MALVSLDDFLTEPNTVYLRTAGQGLLPKSAAEAMHEYAMSRTGTTAHKQGELYAHCKAHVGEILHAKASDIAFTQSTSDALNLIYRLPDWKDGDNVVILDDSVEFPSVTLPATLLTRYGVEVRQVSPGHNESWTQAVSQAVNRSTRIVLFSHVSFRTGRRFDAEAIANACRDQGAQWIVLDASQSLGAVPVPATACDFVVSTGFKWQLGAHGAAILYWNRERTGDVKPRDIGWHSAPDPFATTARDTRTQDGSTPLYRDAIQFEPGNPPYLALSVLNDATSLLANIGARAIGDHVCTLGTYLYEELCALGLDVLTPSEEAERAGIVSWADEEAPHTADKLQARDVLVTGNYGRVRASVHVYNSKADVDALVDAIKS